MRRLKADFHTHTSDDPCDFVEYSAEMLIDAAAAKGVEVLAITCHAVVTHNAYICEYARRCGVLLIPGIESFVEDKHVVILNPDAEQAGATTFEDLRRLGKRDAVFIAPHPYYPSKAALNDKLAENIDLFDAIEYSAFYLAPLNFNRAALRAAKKWSLPLVGNTDTHLFPYDDSTFTWVEAEPNVASVIQALRAGKVEVQTRPRSFYQFLCMVKFSIGATVRARTAQWFGEEYAQ